jgi:hypothetical protein
MAHITMHHSRKQLNLFHNNLVSFINMNFFLYKSINLKINYLVILYTAKLQQKIKIMFGRRSKIFA